MKNINKHTPLVVEKEKYDRLDSQRTMPNIPDTPIRKTRKSNILAQNILHYNS